MHTWLLFLRLAIIYIYLDRDQAQRLQPAWRENTCTISRNTPKTIVQTHWIVIELQQYLETYFCFKGKLYEFQIVQINFPTIDVLKIYLSIMLIEYVLDSGRVKYSNRSLWIFICISRKHIFCFDFYTFTSTSQNLLC